MTYILSMRDIKDKKQLAENKKKDKKIKKLV